MTGASARTEPWRLWILLSPARGTLGREIRYGWETLAEVHDYANLHLRVHDLRAEHRDSGERWNRVRGEWSRVEDRPAPRKSQPLPPERRWWDNN